VNEADDRAAIALGKPKDELEVFPEATDLGISLDERDGFGLGRLEAEEDIGGDAEGSGEFDDDSGGRELSDGLVARESALGGTDLLCELDLREASGSAESGESRSEGGTRFDLLRHRAGECKG
jgi:hypothetical protein